MLVKMCKHLTQHLYVPKQFKCLKTSNFNFVPKRHIGNETKPPWRILFYGSDDFAVPCLRMLYENQLRNNLVSYLEVVSKSSSPSPVTKYAKKSGIKTWNWPYAIPKNTFDIGVVVSFGKLIPEDVICSFPYGMVNVHASLLPRWRGPAPIIHTVLNGDKETGITLIEVAPKKFDVGKILIQNKIQVPDRITSEELYSVLSMLGAKVLEDGLENFQSLWEQADVQRNEGVTQAPKPKKEMAIINWNLISHIEIDRLDRAIGAIFGLKTSFHGLSIRLSDIVDPNEVVDSKLDLLIGNSVAPRPGTAYYHKKRKLLYIKCCDGWCAFKNVNVEKKPKMTANEFAAGYLLREPWERRFFDS